MDNIISNLFVGKFFLSESNILYRSFDISLLLRKNLVDLSYCMPLYLNCPNHILPY